MLGIDILMVDLLAIKTFLEKSLNGFDLIHKFLPFELRLQVRIYKAGVGGTWNPEIIEYLVHILS